ncbi:MAG: TonB-dependent receptor [Steroidobacteraceae bacterium]
MTSAQSSSVTQRADEIGPDPQAGTPLAYSLTPVVTAVVSALYPAASAHAQSPDQGALEEVVVTATKREINLQAVPQSITAFSMSDIEKMAFKSMDDYMKALPSASLVAIMPGRNSLSMRGISTGSEEFHTDSQVSVYLDEQPVGAISNEPEVRMVDIARIESLPGPQGTLFGSSSQSGTLRIITNKPDFTGFSGQVDASLGTTHGGDESYDVSGHLNIPLVDDKLALRIVGFSARDGGYVDNVVGPTISGQAGAFSSPGDNSAIAKNDQNEFEIYGGRVAALWKINDRWTADLGYITQYSTADGTWESDPALGDYKVTRFFPEYRTDDWWQASLTIKGDLGFADFTSATSYYDRYVTYEWDNMTYNQWQTSYYGAPGYVAIYDFQYEFGSTFDETWNRRTAQELRLTSRGDSKLQWMIGGFYEDVYLAWDYGAQIPSLTQTNGWAAAQDYACAYQAAGYDVPCPLPDTNKIYVNNFRKTIKQTAVFGELTYHLTDAWSATAGARWFEFDRKDRQVLGTVGGLPPRGSYGIGEGDFASSGKNSSTVLKFGTQYELSDNKMVYFLYSEGFRLGGNNSIRAAATGSIPATYDPDLLRNYEVGLKSEWLDRRVRLNVTLFDMKWTDIQIYSRVGGGPWWLRGTFNGETGESKGAEISGAWHVTKNFSLQGSAYFAKSEYTADTFDPRGNLFLEKGQEMPNAPKRKLWLAAEYTIPQFAGLPGDLWFRYDTTYRGEAWDNLTAAEDNDPGGRIPSWRSDNAQVGMDFNNGLQVSLMARNIWDEAGVSAISYSDYQSEWFGDSRFRNMRTLQRPRTITLSVRKRF